MNITVLRRKRVLVPVLATAAVLAVGGTVGAMAADDVRGDERDRVAAAATQAAGGGRAVEVEKADDPGESYEVEVRLDDGREVDVTLDDELRMLDREAEDADADADDADDADDRVLPAAERRAAEQAALAAVGGGTVVDIEPGDDPGVAYEVEVRDAAGAEWDVDLDAGFGLVTKVRDR